MFHINASDLQKRIAAERFGVVFTDDGLAGPASNQAFFQTLLDSIADAYETGCREGALSVCHQEMSISERLKTLDTRFLLNMYLGDDRLRVLLLNEIVRRARSGDDPVIGAGDPY